MRKAVILFVTAIIIFIAPFSFSHASALPLPPVSVPANEPDKITIKKAVLDFKALSRKEKKLRIKKAKQAIKDFKQEKKKGNDPDTDTLLLIIFALLLPPLAVYLHQDETNQKFWITTLLFVLGLLGAFLLSWLLILASIVYALLIILGNA